MLSSSSHIVRFGENHAQVFKRIFDIHTRPDEIFRGIAGHKFFSKMDLRSGFHQISVKEQDQVKTGSWWKNKIYMFTRMPFGARNATAHFQRVVDAEIAKAGVQNNASSFVDDILVYSKTAEEHIEHLQKVFDMLESCGLKAHPDKTVLCFDTVEFLGHNVSEHGLTPSEGRSHQGLASTYQRQSAQKCAWICGILQVLHFQIQ